jgi:transposase
MDHAPVHKAEGIKSLIEETGAKLIYLPPYSPEFNPIELAWNKIKQFLRKQKSQNCR